MPSRKPSSRPSSIPSTAPVSVPCNDPAYACAQGGKHVYCVSSIAGSVCVNTPPLTYIYCGCCNGTPVTIPNCNNLNQCCPND
jgi:hypothetical protein